MWHLHFYCLAAFFNFPPFHFGCLPLPSPPVSSLPTSTMRSVVGLRQMDLRQMDIWVLGCLLVVVQFGWLVGFGLGQDLFL